MNTIVTGISNLDYILYTHVFFLNEHTKNHRYPHTLFSHRFSGNPPELFVLVPFTRVLRCKHKLNNEWPQRFLGRSGHTTFLEVEVDLLTGPDPLNLKNESICRNWGKVATQSFSIFFAGSWGFMIQFDRTRIFFSTWVGLKPPTKIALIVESGNTWFLKTNISCLSIRSISEVYNGAHPPLPLQGPL